MIKKKEYASRRSKLLTKLKGAAGLVYAGQCDVSLETTWRPHSHFEYLTGITNEPSAILLLDPSHPVPARREIL